MFKNSPAQISGNTSIERFVTTLQNIDEPATVLLLGKSVRNAWGGHLERFEFCLMEKAVAMIEVIW